MESKTPKKNNYLQYKYAILLVVTLISALKYDLHPT